MAASSVRIRLNETALAAVNQPGGMVSVATDNVSEQIATLARVKSPKRTGNMVRSIATERLYARRTGCAFRVSVNVPYASFVIKGTTGPIRAGLRRGSGGRFAGRATDKRGRTLENRKRLPVGRSQGGPVTYRRSVAGQDANDFLGRAASEVLGRFGI